MYDIVKPRVIGLRGDIVLMVTKRQRLESARLAHDLRGITKSYDKWY
jgi:hypothetical protein